MVSCPKCSHKMNKDGFRKGRQAYRCPACGRQAVDPTLQGKPGRPRKKKTCEICGKTHYAGGLCQPHYRAKRKAENLNK